MNSQMTLIKKGNGFTLKCVGGSFDLVQVPETTLNIQGLNNDHKKQLIKVLKEPYCYMRNEESKPESPVVTPVEAPVDLSTKSDIKSELVEEEEIIDSMTVMPTSPPSSPPRFPSAELDMFHVGNRLPQIESRYDELPKDVLKVLKTFDIIYPYSEATYSMESCFSIDNTLYCANREARRERQRRVRFGFQFSETDPLLLERVNQYQLKMGVQFTMPGVHGEIQSCGSHRQKFGSNEFFSMYVYDRMTDQKALVSEPGEQLPQVVKVAEIPLRRESDPFIFHFVFNCYSSCLNSLGDAKNTLRVQFFLLTAHNEVIQRQEQKIRITANPGRDAKHVEFAQSRRLLRKEENTTRRLAPKAVQSMLPTSSVNGDQVNAKRELLREPAQTKRMKYSIGVEEPIWSILRSLPQTESAGLESQLELIPPSDRFELVNRELTRLSFNLVLALNSYRKEKENKATL